MFEVVFCVTFSVVHYRIVSFIIGRKRDLSISCYFVFFLRRVSSGCLVMTFICVTPWVFQYLFYNLSFCNVINICFHFDVEFRSLVVSVHYLSQVLSQWKRFGEELLIR